MARKAVWTLNDAADQSGKIFVITGANAGLGFESTRALARKNARVIMACRNLEKGEMARKEILEELPDAQIEVRHCDLSDFASVSQFAEELSRDLPKLDVLMNNGAVGLMQRRVNAYGYELNFATNYLGHFALTKHLFPLLKRSAPSRVVSLSSSTHENATINFDDLMAGQEFSGFPVYSQSKLANVLFARELQKRLDATDLNLVSVAAHPGLINTGIFREAASGSRLMSLMMGVFAPIVMDQPEVGARAQVYAATEPDISPGGYYGPNKRGRPSLDEPSEEAQNPEIAKRLWQVAEELLDMEFKVSD